MAQFPVPSQYRFSQQSVDVVQLPVVLQQTVPPFVHWRGLQQVTPPHDGHPPSRPLQAASSELPSAAAPADMPSDFASLSTGAPAEPSRSPELASIAPLGEPSSPTVESLGCRCPALPSGSQGAPHVR